MRMISGPSIKIRCICGSNSDEHAPGCPQAALKGLVIRQRHIPCPKCDHLAVDVNAMDYYECRNCHRQFTIADMLAGNPERLFIDDPKKSDICVVVEFPNKGKGDFPLDREISKARAAYEKAVRKKRR